ncbi:hypothetical protein GYH30_035476 [Glycine max]|uniref:Zinc-ribbon 15 domain-containing protein n=1 Tax=Glycine max TaxID=3847 RepID=A0A0R0GUW7_SOYBN|nr:hypothetical protein GYH30_035476 [Glycine max]
MFFFFVGGLPQELRQVLKSGVGKCTCCANNRVDLVNYDKVLKLFFVPGALRCRLCDRAVEADFRFCPFCGSEL